MEFSILFTNDKCLWAIKCWIGFGKSYLQMKFTKHQSDTNKFQLFFIFILKRYLFIIYSISIEILFLKFLLN